MVREVTYDVGKIEAVVREVKYDVGKIEIYEAPLSGPAVPLSEEEARRCCEAYRRKQETVSYLHSPVRQKMDELLEQAMTLLADWEAIDEIRIKDGILTITGRRISPITDE